DPAGPCGPIAPSAPAGPCGPCGPAGPCVAGRPLWALRTGWSGWTGLTRRAGGSFDSVAGVVIAAASERDDQEESRSHAEPDDIDGARSRYHPSVRAALFAVLAGCGFHPDPATGQVDAMVDMAVGGEMPSECTGWTRAPSNF